MEMYEFMSRATNGGETTFLASASGAVPYARLSRTGSTVTGMVSADGVTWTTVGSTPLEGDASIGFAVTSHDNATLNTSTFDSVTFNSSDGGSGLPAPWQQTDIGNVGQAGSATNQDPKVFEITGAGGDIWGAADAFHFVYTPLAGDAALSSQVLGEQNTSVFAKAGLMIRATTDPGAATVILDVVPSGAVEFMARTSAGASMVFIAGSAVDQFPRSLALSREGGTVTGYVDGVSVGSVLIPDFASGGVLAGLAVTSHDTSITNTGAFTVPTITVNTLPSGWHAQDVGATGLPGSSSFDSTSNTFTIKGAGADIWGTVDAFQYAYRPSGNTNAADITVKVVSEDASNRFAKAGVMYRGGLAPDAAFAIFDMVPDGHVEFMARPSDGAPVQVVASAYVGFNALLDLYVEQNPGAAGPRAFASYSTDDGQTWTSLNTVQLTLTAPPVSGLISCSHDPSTLNTAVMTLSDVRPPH